LKKNHRQTSWNGNHHVHLRFRETGYIFQGNPLTMVRGFITVRKKTLPKKKSFPNFEKRNNNVYGTNERGLGNR